jgi:copper ion binding protein
MMTTVSRTFTYGVRGMTCDHCVAAVTGEVSRVAGVSGVAVDLAAGTVVVTSAGPVDEAAVRAAIDEAGYEMAGP